MLFDHCLYNGHVTLKSPTPPPHFCTIIIINPCRRGITAIVCCLLHLRGTGPSTTATDLLCWSLDCPIESAQWLYWLKYCHRDFQLHIYYTDIARCFPPTPRSLICRILSTLPSFKTAISCFT